MSASTVNEDSDSNIDGFDKEDLLLAARHANKYDGFNDEDNFTTRQALGTDIDTEDIQWMVDSR